MENPRQVRLVVILFSKKVGQINRLSTQQNIRLRLK